MNELEQARLAALIARDELRAAAREVLPTVGQMVAEQYPTPTEVERERYARKPRKGRA